jgi:hypothetical protein
MASRDDKRERDVRSQGRSPEGQSSQCQSSQGQSKDFTGSQSPGVEPNSVQSEAEAGVPPDMAEIAERGEKESDREPAPPLRKRPSSSGESADTPSTPVYERDPHIDVDRKRSA